MASKQDTASRSKKYFFDANNFDDARPEDDIPPAPVYSQEQIDAARQESYERGRNDGLNEAKASREKQVADLIAKIQQNFSTLFAAEATRITLHQGETVSLARAIFTRLFPGLNERNGLDETLRIIATVLESHKTRPEMVIEVRPDHVEAIRTYIDEALKSLHGTGVCTVAGNEALGAGDCRITWNDGGASRDASHLAEQVAQVLEQTLAETPGLRDNMKGDSGAPNSGKGD